MCAIAQSFLCSLCVEKQSQVLLYVIYLHIQYPHGTVLISTQGDICHLSACFLPDSCSELLGPPCAHLSWEGGSDLGERWKGVRDEVHVRVSSLELVLHWWFWFLKFMSMCLQRVAGDDLSTGQPVKAAWCEEGGLRHHLHAYLPAGRGVHVGLCPHWCGPQRGVCGLQRRCPGRANQGWWDVIIELLKLP